jgi:hypothetical protein
MSNDATAVVLTPAILTSFAKPKSNLSPTSSPAPSSPTPPPSSFPSPTPPTSSSFTDKCRPWRNGSSFGIPSLSFLASYPFCAGSCARTSGTISANHRRIGRPANSPPRQARPRRSRRHDRRAPHRLCSVERPRPSHLPRRPRRHRHRLPPSPAATPSPRQRNQLVHPRPRRRPLHPRPRRRIHRRTRPHPGRPNWAQSLPAGQKPSHRLLRRPSPTTSSTTFPSA